jgi:sodium/bile acid cotransporter 7
MQSSPPDVQPTRDPSQASTKNSIDEVAQNGIQPMVSNGSKAEAATHIEGSCPIQANVAKETPHDEDQGSTKWQSTIATLKWFIKDQWFLIAMGILILISSQVQVPDAQQRVKRTVITYLSVSVIFFCNGCTLDTKLLIENYMRWKLHAFVQLQCYLVTSAATFGVVSLCATNPNFSTYS